MSVEQRCHGAAVVMVALTFCSWARGQLKTELPTLEMELGLTGAVWTEAPNPDGPTLLLDLAQYGERWERVWGIARNYNVAIHSGRVVSAAISDTQVTVRLTMKIEPDAWVPGGRGSYEVALERGPDGGLQGTFRGTYRSQAVQGRAFGRVKPPVKLLADYVPVQPGEHPRVLFRKEEVPRLRERAKTELGRAALALMGSAQGCGDAIGMGVQYHVTGDKKWAEMARESTAKHMADQSVPAFARGRQWGPRLEQVAVAYDLCYDAWPVEFRRQVEGYLRFVCYQAFHDQTKLGQSINWNVGSNYAGPIFAGAGFAGMALWGEKGPEPAKPGLPSAVPAIPAAEGYKPSRDVPVVKLATAMSKSPTEWLIAGPLQAGWSLDPMVSLGGLESLRAEPGTKITVDEQEVAFALLDPKHVNEREGVKTGISLEAGLKPGRVITLLAYTVLDVPEARQLKVRAPFSRSGRVQVVLNGVRVAHEQVIRVEKGLCPMLVALRLAAKWRSLEPWFEEATREDIERSEAAAASAKAEYDEALKDWEFDRREWQRLGEADVNFLRLFEMGRRMMYLFCREACGTGGYQTESGHYFNDAIDGPGRYASAYRTMFGRDVSSFEDIGAYLPRLIFARVYRADGKSDALNISSSVTPNGARCADLYPVVPDRLKPVVLWHWNRDTGGSAEKPDLAKIAAAAPVQAFLHYPLDGKPQPPEGIMPLTWEAPTFGYYGFRNTWRGDDDIVFQVFAKQHGPGGWGGADAGTFRLWGLGHPWAVGNTGREVRRWLESVVLLPEDKDLTESGLGRVIHVERGKDGSGAVSVDLTDLFYNHARKEGPWVEIYGGVRHEPKGKPAATALRAVAVDCSGACGAPCLLAIVDKIDGGKSKEWYWHVPNVNAVTTDDKGFTITQGDVTLRATFLAPAKVEVQATREGRKTTKSAGHVAGSTIVLNLSAVIAQGTQPTDGHFFVVATLQKGPAPQVKVSGAGLDARAAVGKRLVRFDGERLLME